MTKISFDVDFTKDPEKILQEIQERAKAEVEKRESKERNAAYLSKLHEQVNEKLGTDFKSVSDLIRALTPFAAPSLREKLSGTTSSGRRKTISMNKEVFDKVKDMLDKPNPNKAAIARETGISVVQVRKVAEGGFDKKFGEIAPSVEEQPVKPTLPKIETPKKEEQPESKTESTPPPALPSFEDAKEISTVIEDSSEELTSNEEPADSPSFGESEESSPPPIIKLTPPPPAPDLPPPAPSGLDESEPATEENQEEGKDLLPPLPKFTPAPFVSDDSETTTEADSEETTPPLPSFGDDQDEPLAPADLAPPVPTPELPPLPPTDSNDSPSENEESLKEGENLLPPLPQFTPSPFESAADSSSDSDEPPPPLPSFGDEESVPPPPPLPSADSTPPMPDLPSPAPSSETTEEEPPPSPDVPADAPVPPAPPPSAPTGGLTRPPSGLKPTLKPKLGVGKKGKPGLSLKPKSKTTGLKITRPPMRGNPPPS